MALLERIFKWLSLGIWDLEENQQAISKYHMDKKSCIVKQNINLKLQLYKDYFSSQNWAFQCFK